MRKAVRNVSKDQAIFSRTSAATRNINREPYRNMRGGIRL